MKLPLRQLDKHLNDGLAKVYLVAGDETLLVDEALEQIRAAAKNADFTTRRLVDKIDMKPTLINAITACEPGTAKVPATYETDREAVEAALSCIGLTPPERARVIRIKNTLMIGELEVSEAFAPDVARRSDLTVLGEGLLSFDATGRLAAFAPEVHRA